jgi:hypothetical protein
MTLLKRLMKLEAKAVPAPGVMLSTCEERQVVAYELFLAVSTSDREQSVKERAGLISARIAADIRACAEKQRTSQYEFHIKDYLEDVWKASGHRDPFLSPVVGSEYDDWDKPELYTRRLAIRARPSIVALIGRAPTDLCSEISLPPLNAARVVREMLLSRGAL